VQDARLRQTSLDGLVHVPPSQSPFLGCYFDLDLVGTAIAAGLALTLGRQIGCDGACLSYRKPARRQ
jgi:hypothetical protein